jgi:hypothetical protein
MFLHIRVYSNEEKTEHTDIEMWFDSILTHQQVIRRMATPYGATVIGAPEGKFGDVCHEKTEVAPRDFYVKKSRNWREGLSLDPVSPMQQEAI